MISDIYGRISRTGSNLSERLEDKLTGDFFGAIRYLPFEVALRPVLGAALPQNSGALAEHFKTQLDSIQGFDYDVQFWPRGQYGEIDLTIKSKSFVIGIEVKYLSGLSSDDDAESTGPYSDVNESKNQLLRYAKELDDIPNGHNKHLILLAPASLGFAIAQMVVSRALIPSRVAFWLLTWQNVLRVLNELPPVLDSGRACIVQDLRQLLKRKGFDAFSGFEFGSGSILADLHYCYDPALTVDWPLRPLIAKGIAYEFR